jgi:hypothetical protein
MAALAPPPNSRNNHAMLTDSTAFSFLWRWRKPAA